MASIYSNVQRGCCLLLALAAAALESGCGGSDAHAQTAREAGANNAITDVDGIKVGQYNQTGNGYQTGTTVVWAPEGAMGSAYNAGGWVGSINTDVLQPGKNEQNIDVAFLTGGSYFGLQAFGGIIEWLEQNGYGLQVGAGNLQCDPLVSGSVVYDLNRGGTFTARPNYDFGRKAMEAAATGPVAQGNVGAGTGTSSGVFRLKGGIGTASEIFEGIQVGMITAVNAAGTPVSLTDCSLRGTELSLNNEFAKYTTPSSADCENAKTKRNIPLATSEADIRAINQAAESFTGHPQTTISIIATNAILTRTQANQLAREVNNAKAQVIIPFNTGGDGDSVYAMATGKVAVDEVKFQKLLSVARSVAGRAVAHAMLSATTFGTLESYCTALPSACLP
jgi:putative pantetheine hydrolase